MYRHSAALNRCAKTNGLLSTPTNEDPSASESESDTIAKVEQKRRQVDEEIANFKTQKEKEFQDFEQELRRKRKRKRSPVNGESHLARTPTTDPSVLSLLGSRPQANGHASKHSGRAGPRSVPTPTPSKPTLSVEKLTIVGTTATLPSAETSPAVLSRSLTSTSTPPQYQSEEQPPLPRKPDSPKQELPPTPIARDHNDPFAGVFTPSYLPLLDSRSSSSNSIPQAQSERLPLSRSEPIPQTPQAESTSSSLPSSPISPRIPSPQKRSYTAPLLPSSSLPSALRVTSGDGPSRKRKHVTFRLADSVVVEPSSSYEEMSSPDLPSENGSASSNGKGKMNGKVMMTGIDARLNNEEVPWSWSKGQTSPLVEKSGMELAGDGEEEEEVTSTAMAIDDAAQEESTSSFHVNSFEEAEDGGSGVGFFELEEELSNSSPGLSPRIHSPRSDRARFFDDWGAVPDDEDEGMADQDQSGEQGALTREMEEGDPAQEVRGLGIAKAGTKESTFSSGSVPIDIVVRPSSSWVGSFAAGSAPREREYVP